eukprot:gene297-231_t
MSLLLASLNGKGLRDSSSAIRLAEELKFPERYIESVVTPDGHSLRAGRKMREAFRAHFQERFTRLPNLPVQ